MSSGAACSSEFPNCGFSASRQLEHVLSASRRLRACARENLDVLRPCRLCQADFHSASRLRSCRFLQGRFPFCFTASAIPTTQPARTLFAVSSSILLVKSAMRVSASAMASRTESETFPLIWTLPDFGGEPRGGGGNLVGDPGSASSPADPRPDGQASDTPHPLPLPEERKTCTLSVLVFDIPICSFLQLGAACSSEFPICFTVSCLTAASSMCFLLHGGSEHVLERISTILRPCRLCQADFHSASRLRTCRFLQGRFPFCFAASAMPTLQGRFPFASRLRPYRLCEADLHSASLLRPCRLARGISIPLPGFGHADLLLLHGFLLSRVQPSSMSLRGMVMRVSPAIQAFPFCFTAAASCT